MSRIVVCGRKTELGKAVSAELKQQGYEVVLISADELSENNAPLIAKKFDGALAVCNTIGVPYVAHWSDTYVHDIYCSRMLAIREIIEAFRYCKEKPKAFIHVSNAMVYDEYEVHDEFSTQYTDSFTAEVGLMETKEVLKAHKRNPEMRLSIVRSGYLMYRSGGLFKVLHRVCNSRVFGCLGDGFQCLPMIHIKDAAKAISMITADDNAVGIINLTIPSIASMRELTVAIRNKSRGPHITLPDFVVKFLVGRAVSMLEQNCKVIPSRLTSMGFTFTYPNVDSIISDLYK